MKVHIVTFHDSYNYGARLQAYALQKCLNKWGYSNDLLAVPRRKVGIYDRITNPKKILKNLVTFLYRKSIQLGRKNYDNFLKEYLTVVPYPEKLEVEDVYLSGSDQVWNPISFLPGFFLDFVPDEAKKISYAASMGTEIIPPEKVEKFKEYIKRFHAISVRENHAQKVISAFTEKPISVNIDPIFLLSKEEWRTLEKTVEVKKPYILVYAIYQPEWLNRELKKLRKKTGYDIVLVYNCAYRNIYHNRFIRFAGPSEFLYLIDHAEMVVSSSFHGVAFSVLFEKEFFAVVNPEKPSRISNLLEVFGLQDRNVTAFDLPKDKIDSCRITMTRNEECQKSREYLKRAIEE